MIFLKAFSGHYFKENKKPQILALRNYNPVAKGIHNIYMLIQVDPSQSFANMASKCEKDSFQSVKVV